MKKTIRNGVALAGLAFALACTNQTTALAGTITELESTARSNETFETAEKIKVNSTVKGFFTDFKDSERDIDMYKVVLSSTGRITIDLSSYVNATDLIIYNESGDIVSREGFQQWDGATQLLHRVYSYDLKKGTYYIGINNTKNSFMDYMFNKYSFDLKFTSAKVNHSEKNDLFAEAGKITFNKKYMGQLSRNDCHDYYKFSVPSKGFYQLVGESKAPRTFVKLYKSNGDMVKEFNFYRDEAIQKGLMNDTVELEKGEYIVYFSSIVNQYDLHTGAYNFTIKPKVAKIKLNKTSLSLKAKKTYQLKATITPSVANNKKVTWTSSNKSVATVSSTGKVTAKKKGTAYISCSAKDGSGVVKKIKVTVK